MKATGLQRHRNTPNFDRVARLYRWAEYLIMGCSLQRTRESLLGALAGTRRALVLGDGDGRFLAELLRSQPDLEAIAVDSSATMLELLEHRCRFAEGRLHTVQGLVADLPSDLDLNQIDVIVTHFLLDCLSQRETNALAKTLAGRVAPGARWLVSDFAYPQRQPWRALGLVFIRVLYAAFFLLTSLPVKRLPGITEALETAGFALQCRVLHAKGLLFSELWRLPGTNAGLVTTNTQLPQTPRHPPLSDRDLPRHADERSNQ